MDQIKDLCTIQKLPIFLGELWGRSLQANRISVMDGSCASFVGCQMLLPENSDVKEGKANGIQATFQKAILKAGVSPRKVVIGGIPINAVFASEVDHVVLHHINERIKPQIFSLKPKEHRFKAQIVLPPAYQHKWKTRESLSMTAIQLPMLVNNATTGHKLQGSSVDNILSTIGVMYKTGHLSCSHVSKLRVVFS